MKPGLVLIGRQVSSTHLNIGYKWCHLLRCPCRGICVYTVVLTEFVHGDRGVSVRFEVDLTVIKEQCYKCGLGQSTQTQNEQAAFISCTQKGVNTHLNKSNVGSILSTCLERYVLLDSSDPFKRSAGMNEDKAQTY